MVEAGKGTYQGTKESDLIDEKIDEVILRALGLDDVFDLDYDTYKTLLKERMMADRMGQKMDSGESEAVTDEYKRVKTKVGRFRLNKKKINVGAFKTKTSKPANEPTKPVAKMLPGSTFSTIQKLTPLEKEPEVAQQKAQKEKPPSTKKEPKVAQQEPQKEKKPFTYNFKKIENILSDIIKNLKETFSFEKNTEKEKNQEEGRKKKKERESTLEKTIGVVAKIGKKILEPLKGPLDYIINWITYTFLGKVFNNILNWASNPDNSKKMMSITRFLKDWWPALVGAYVIFGTSLGGFVSKLIFTVGAFTAKMLVGAIPKLLSLVKSPLGAGALLFGAGAAIPMLMPETVNEEERKTEDKVKKKGKDKVRAELERQANNPNLYERLTGQDAEAKEQLYKIETGETKSYRRGGKVTGQSGTDIRGAGADTQLIAAQPGEIVINKPTVNALGPEFFLALNKKHGGSGANKPKMAKNIQTAAGGGLVLPAFSSGGMIPGDEPDMSNRGRGGNGSLSNIKNFIKQKIGYDVDKPETWGPSFSSAFTDKSSGSKPPKSKGKGFDFIATAKGLANKAQGLGQGLANQGMGLTKSATDPRSYQGLANQAQGLGQGLANQGMSLAKSATDPRSYQGLANQGMGLTKSATDPRSYQGLANQAQGLDQGLANQGMGLTKSATDPRSYQGLANQGMGLVKKTVNTVKKYGRNALNYVADRPYFGETAAIENERKLGLMKPGADSLTDKRKKQLADKDAYVEGLYDPKKDKGPLGFVKKVNQNIQNKGLFADPFAASGLKEEGTEKFVEEISRGKIKNFGAKITGLQFALKGLLGPLGKAFQIDDRGSLGRYLRPAMLEAQKQGNSSVGAQSFGQPKYDKLVNDKIANYALGQTGFTVDKTGRAKTKDVFDSNDTAEAYFKRSRLALKSGNPMGAVFPGLSGVLRANQNAEYSNLRPGGNNIDLGGGFKQTDAGGNVLSSRQIEQMEQQERERLSRSQGSLYSSNDPRRKNTGQPYQSKFASSDQKALDSRNEINRRKETNQKALEAKRPFYDPFGIFGGASAKIQKKQGGGLIGMQGGGSIEGKSDAPFGTRLIRLLGDLGLPNTGNVMAPRSSGPKDVRGIRQTSAGYENRLFGSRLGTYFPSGLRGEYDEMEKKRYYQRSGKSFRSTLYGTLDPNGYIPYDAEEGMPGLYTPPKSRRQQQQQQQKPQTNESLVGNSFRDFGKNVQTIKDASKAREEMMLQMGIKPDGYVNLGGRPIKKKQGGGGIKENTGMNIAGAAADRQLIAAQPGEYMLTLDTVAKLGGVGAIDRLVARLDSNSNPAKMGKNLKPLPGPPLSAGRSGMMTLPPISGGSGGGSGGGGGKGSRKQVPSFSATSPYVGERQNKADIYGIK